MKIRLLVLLLAAVGTANALADLKPDLVDCDAKKAARNAVADATVGVSGRCDPKKAAQDTKEDVTDEVKDAVDIDRDEKHRLRDGDTSDRKQGKDKD